MSTYKSGTLIANRYEVAGHPLVGGMGVVYVCLDREEGRPVALKTFKAEYLANRAARDRFLREGTAWVKLGKHPHIVQCYGVEYIGDGREVYMVLELVAKPEGYPNASLRAWLLPGKRLRVEQALLFGIQIARGMQHATEVLPGFVHRDLKPENLLVGADRLGIAGVNRLRVTDFGLVSVLLEVGSRSVVWEAGGRAIANLRQTQLTHGAVGTPGYMAPEQWGGGEVGVWTDVYALGCILYEMLAGQPAVEGRNLSELEKAHCRGIRRALPAGLPREVTALIEGCLLIESKKRPASWEEVESRLAEAYAGVAGRTAPVPAKRQGLEQAEREAVGWAYHAIGSSYIDIGKFEVAQDCFERVVEIGLVEDEPSLIVEGWRNLGGAYGCLGDYRRAIKYQEQALAIAQKIRDRGNEGSLLGNLGTTYSCLGDYRRSIELYQQALAIAREIYNRRDECLWLGNLGSVYNNLGDYRRAIKYSEQAQAIAREIGDQRIEGISLINMGDAYRELGDYRRAIKYQEQALAIARAIGDRRGEGAYLGNLGLAYADLGEARRAIEYYEQALAIAREIGDRGNQFPNLANLGNDYYKLGDYRRAIKYQEQALAIAWEIGHRPNEGRSLDDLGDTYLALEDYRRAVEQYQQALAIAREIGDRRGEANRLGNLGKVYAALGTTKG